MAALYEIRKAFVKKIIDNVTFVSQSNMQLSENKVFSPQSDTEWLRLTIRTGSAIEGEKGPTGIDIQYGVAFIDLNFPLNQGDNTIMSHADTIVTLFRRDDLDYGVRCMTVDASPGGEVDSFYRVQIIVNFYHFIEG